MPVLIYGETGKGKELAAHSLHNASKRQHGPFIIQNCASIPANLMESILFGTSKGAFTGAVDNMGLLELADGGTLFLYNKLYGEKTHKVSKKLYHELSELQWKGHVMALENTIAYGVGMAEDDADILELGHIENKLQML